MSNIVKGRMTAELDREIVVFLIGMRINKLWKVHQWWPVAMAMPRMIRELSTQPGLGFLHAEQWFGRTTIMVQYWQSFDHLETYAKNRDHVHLPDGPHSIGTLVTMEMLVYGTKPISYRPAVSKRSTATCRHSAWPGQRAWWKRVGGAIARVSGC